MKKPSVWPTLVAVPLVLVVGGWALATIRLQTELLPLLPQTLASVRGMSLFQSAFTSAQDVTVVLTNVDAASALEQQLRKLPEVEATTTLGGRQLEPMVKSLAWMIANLPPEKFTEFQALFTPEQLDARLQTARDDLAGAVNFTDAALLQIDPLGLLPWMRENAGVSLPNGDAPNFVAIVVHARRELRTFEDCQRFVSAVHGVVGTNGLITGRPAFVSETSKQMQRDMTLMMGVATLLVAVAFWLFYRSLGALLWILLLQVLAVLCGVAAARLLFGELNVLSIGFASILLGVGMDYCILVYHFHASGEHDDKHWRTLRGAIWLSAVTTAASFGILYFSSFPGLQQLSVLIAAGLLATAFFATETEPLVLRRTKPVAPRWLMTSSDGFAAFISRYRRGIMGALIASLVFVACLFPVLRRYKFYDSDLKRLRPTGSEAYRGLDLLLMAQPSQELFELIVSGKTWDELRANVSKTAGASSPLLMPQDDFLERNRAAWELGKSNMVMTALERAGFDASWGRATTKLLVELDHPAADIFISNVAKLPDGQKLALLRLPSEVNMPEALPASWSLLTRDLGRTARTDFRRLSLWILAVVIGLCWLAHRSVRLVVLNMVGLLISVLGLFLLLFVTRQSMTLLSLLSVPLLVGMIIDISLHLVLAMEQNQGDLRETFRHMAGPVLLTGLTSMIGFGAPMVTQQPVLQNFGMIMDLGILAAVFTGLVLLPVFYSSAHERPHYSQMLYRAFWFELAARLRPSRRLGRWLGEIYAVTHPHRRKVVRSNLALIGSNGDARRVFANFGQTLADYFSLDPGMIAENIGSEHLYKLAGEGKGAVLVTVHLGLFELGGMLMPKIGQNAIVLTAPEPSPSLGRWRAKFRASWGAETLEVGNDNFNFVEVTRRLAQGRCVAMLMDRPYGGNFIIVDKVPFSTGPVWLSLLSGAPIVAVTVTALPTGGYRVEARPPIFTQWLPEGRDETVRHYTKEVACIFRDAICKHPDQWYQFVDLSAPR